MSWDVLFQAWVSPTASLPTGRTCPWFCSAASASSSLTCVSGACSCRTPSTPSGWRSWAPTSPWASSSWPASRPASTLSFSATGFTRQLFNHCFTANLAKHSTLFARKLNILIFLDLHRCSSQYRIERPPSSTCPRYDDSTIRHRRDCDKTINYHKQSINRYHTVPVYSYRDGHSIQDDQKR